MIIEFIAALALGGVQDSAPATLECHTEGSEPEARELPDGTVMEFREGAEEPVFCRYDVPEGTRVTLGWPRDDADCVLTRGTETISNARTCGGEFKGPAEGEFTIR